MNFKYKINRLFNDLPLELARASRGLLRAIVLQIEELVRVGRQMVVLSIRVIRGVVASIFAFIRSVLKQSWKVFLWVERQLLGAIAETAVLSYTMRYFACIFLVAYLLYRFEYWIPLALYVTILLLSMVRFYRPVEDKEEDQSSENWKFWIVRYLRYPLRAAAFIVPFALGLYIWGNGAAQDIEGSIVNRFWAYLANTKITSYEAQIQPTPVTATAVSSDSATVLSALVTEYAPILPQEGSGNRHAGASIGETDILRATALATLAPPPRAQTSGVDRSSLVNRNEIDTFVREQQILENRLDREAQAKAALEQQLRLVQQNAERESLERKRLELEILRQSTDAEELQRQRIEETEWRKEQDRLALERRRREYNEAAEKIATRAAIERQRMQKEEQRLLAERHKREESARESARIARLTYVLTISNNCSYPAQVALSYTDMAGRLTTFGWLKLDKRSDKSTRIITTQPFVYLYAQSRGGTVWEGNAANSKHSFVNLHDDFTYYGLLKSDGATRKPFMHYKLTGNNMKFNLQCP